MSKEQLLSPEQKAFLAQVVEKQVGIKYKWLLSSFSNDPGFLEYREGRRLTEDDLIATILEEGEAVLGQGADFEDLVTVGATAIASTLGLL